MNLNMFLVLLLGIKMASAYPTSASDCPTGWVNSAEGCFLLHYTKACNWRDAQEECEAMGGFLAEIKSEEQAMLLVRREFIIFYSFSFIIPRPALQLSRKIF